MIEWRERPLWSEPLIGSCWPIIACQKNEMTNFVFLWTLFEQKDKPKARTMQFAREFGGKNCSQGRS
jgi:hypothetical protein